MTLHFDIWKKLSHKYIQHKKCVGNKKTLNCIFFLTLLPRETRVKGIFSTTSTCKQHVKGIFSTKKKSTKKEDILRHKKWKIWLTSNMSTFSTLPVTRRKRRSWKKNKLHYISQSVYSFALKAIVNSIERLDGLLVRAIWYHGNLDRIFVRKTLNCSAENSLRKKTDVIALCSKIL